MYRDGGIPRGFLEMNRHLVPGLINMISGRHSAGTSHGYRVGV